MCDNTDNLWAVGGSYGGASRECGGVRDNLAVRGYVDARSVPGGSKSTAYNADNNCSLNHRKSDSSAAKRGNTRDSDSRRRIVNIVDNPDKVKPQADNKQLKIADFFLFGGPPNFSKKYLTNAEKYVIIEIKPAANSKRAFWSLYSKATAKRLVQIRNASVASHVKREA